MSNRGYSPWAIDRQSASSSASSSPVASSSSPSLPSRNSTFSPRPSPPSAFPRPSPDGKSLSLRPAASLGLGMAPAQRPQQQTAAAPVPVRYSYPPPPMTALKMLGGSSRLVSDYVERGKGTKLTQNEGLPLPPPGADPGTHYRDFHEKASHYRNLQGQARVVPVANDPDMPDGLAPTRDNVIFSKPSPLVLLSYHKSGVFHCVRKPTKHGGIQLDPPKDGMDPQVSATLGRAREYQVFHLLVYVHPNFSSPPNQGTYLHGTAEKIYLCAILQSYGRGRYVATLLSEKDSQTKYVGRIMGSKLQTYARSVDNKEQQLWPSTERAWLNEAARFRVDNIRSWKMSEEKKKKCIQQLVHSGVAGVAIQFSAQPPKDSRLLGLATVIDLLPSGA